MTAQPNTPDLVARPDPHGPELRAADAWRRRLLHGRVGDPHLLLAFALAATTLVAEVASNTTEVGRAAALSGAYLLIQGFLASSARDRSRSVLPLARLLIDLVFVSAIGLLEGGINARPIGILYLPIIVMAAAISRRETVAVGTIALTLFLLPRVLNPVASEVIIERTIVLAGTAVFLAIGTRHTIASLEHARDRARRAMTEDRKRGRQLAGLEAVGRLLAQAGPTPEAMGEVVDVLHRRFDYDYPSIYLVDGNLLRLGAQRGYDQPLHEIPTGDGIVGRVVRTGEVSFVPDVRSDPDYLSANPDIESEISVPVKVDDEVVGVLSVESTSARRLDESDVGSMVLVADRLASALALARERETLAARAQLFERLSSVAARLSATLEPSAVSDTVARAFADVVPCDHAALVSRDPAGGGYHMAAVTGHDGGFIGLPIRPGEGMAGRAIAERQLIVDQNYERARFPAGMREVAIERVGAAAVPLIHDDEVLGAVSLARTDSTRRFTALELEVLPLVAHQAAVALRNAHLMTAIREASVRDPLTGLYNRRHFDASVERLIAARRRLPEEKRQPVSAILFDLDHFGALNKRHGHVAGDAVLRAFAGILRDRFRASDIVARFGGEEFVVVLDGASRDQAVAAAESVRRSLAERAIEAPAELAIRATVSAGCAALADDATSAAQLLEIADVGLAMAKQAGRNQVVAA